MNLELATRHTSNASPNRWNYMSYGSYVIIMITLAETWLKYHDVNTARTNIFELGLIYYCCSKDCVCCILLSENTMQLQSSPSLYISIRDKLITDATKRLLSYSV